MEDQLTPAYSAPRRHPFSFDLGIRPLVWMRLRTALPERPPIALLRSCTSSDRIPCTALMEEGMVFRSAKRCRSKPHSFIPRVDSLLHDRETIYRDLGNGRRDLVDTDRKIFIGSLLDCQPKGNRLHPIDQATGKEQLLCTSSSDTKRPKGQGRRQREFSCLRHSYSRTLTAESEIAARQDLVCHTKAVTVDLTDQWLGARPEVQPPSNPLPVPRHVPRRVGSVAPTRRIA